MALSNHYCVECDTHFGGAPNFISPDEHIDIAHDGGAARIIENGNYEDWQRKQAYGVELDIPDR